MHYKILGRWLMGALGLLLSIQSATGQAPGKPKLIREPVQEAPAEKEKDAKSTPVKPDPVLAKKHFEVGKYYFARKNWAAAADRFQLSARLQASRAEYWDWWMRSCEKENKYEEAIRVLQEYEQKFPDSPESKRFALERERLVKKTAERDAASKRNPKSKEEEEKKPVHIERP